MVRATSLEQQLLRQRERTLEHRRDDPPVGDDAARFKATRSCSDPELH